MDAAAVSYARISHGEIFIVGGEGAREESLDRYGGKRGTWMRVDRLGVEVIH